ncbi:molybdopterin molybdotransferase MoeA [Patulibacter brassicae]|uniref:Molybdopterin molybdenumtransferase n=1 Tax=Patulibacter brassicae TaxID=1705717 RepID=A0ABU4VLZ3_9ACTN|nr:gephyrin-like molybdotransferase Glp [Patulibacter brassicae]MDX8152387.1 molybdopterin molybdotransferase MoeA [Patulibacter brassicae]
MPPVDPTRRAGSTTVADARTVAITIGGEHPTAVERLSPAAAAGRVLAEDVVVPLSLPPFDNSAMDGFAVRAADTAAAPVALPLVAESRAGHPAAEGLVPGTAARISTGARMPEGADAVVRVEDADEEDGAVRVRVAVTAGHDVRRAGEDVRAGEPALAAGALLHAGRIALLGGLGIAEVAVARRPTVTVVATGDEVLVGGGELADGQVHDVNGLVLPALLAAAGAGTVDVVRVGDDRDATIAAIGGAGGDVVVTCGGVSVGRHDHVRPALAALGADERAYGLDLQPGRPTWIGTLPAADGRGARPAFGLPGNPASALVTAALLVVPALRAMTGGVVPPPLRLPLTEAAPPGRRTRALRARRVADADGMAVALLGPQQSHRLRPLADADALAIVPAADAPTPAGTPVDVLPLPGAEAGA